MAKMIFNLSLPKNATTSLEKCLETLGYNVCGGNKDNNHTNMLYSLLGLKAYDEIMDFVRHTEFDVFSDGPWHNGHIYQLLYSEFPKAKFILSVREPEKWHDSFIRTVIGASNQPIDASQNLIIEGLYKNGAYGFASFLNNIIKFDRLVDKERLMDMYVEHNYRVINIMGQNPNFLLIDIKKDMNWKRICSFLNKEIPEKLFPKVNVSYGKSNKNYNIPYLF